MNTDKCPTYNAPAKMTWSGLDLVAESGDETLASKHYEYQPNGNNTLLAVSGPSEEEIDLAAMQYATKMSSAPDKETPDWIMTDFKAGIAWLLRYQAACASAKGGPAED